jgi:hypothetical protein
MSQELSNDIMNSSIQWFLTSASCPWKSRSSLGLQLPKWELTRECGGSFPHTFLNCWEHAMWLPCNVSLLYIRISSMFEVYEWKNNIIWGIIRCRHLENKLKTHDECFPQPHTLVNNGMKFWGSYLWQGFPWQQFY